MTDGDKFGTRNNHFVPQFIQKWFGNNINVFNIPCQQYYPDRNPRSVFAEMGIYPDELETKFNEKMESHISGFLAQKILSREDKIEMSLRNLLNLKRFFILAMMRVPEGMEMANGIKVAYPIQRRLFDPQSRYASEMDSEESSADYWLRTLNVLLDVKELTSENVYNHPDSTYLAYYWTTIFLSGCFAFWDAPPGYEFVLTDAGMVSEVETRSGLEWEQRKFLTLRAWHSFYRDSMGDGPMKETKLRSINQMAFWQAGFHENFYMFPVSSKGMIVLYNPFFKEYRAISHSIPVPPLCYFTGLTDIGVYAENKSNRIIGDEKPRLPTDKYTYHPVVLTPEEIRYCNGLLMDRTRKWLGFGSMGGVYESILEYGKDHRPRVDYTGLYEIARQYKTEHESDKSDELKQND